jgi:hypothetical protein
MAFGKGFKKSTGSKGVALNLATLGIPKKASAMGGFQKAAKVLTTKERKELPSSELANPKKEGEESGSYPIPDKAHARNALARVSQFGSPAMKKKVRAKVHKEFPEIGKSSDKSS